MKGIILVTCLLSVNIHGTHGLRTRIFKGIDAPEGLYKYHVHITAKRGNRNYCGGSIINHRWILTAAHCFEGERIRNILVQVGSTTRSGDAGTFYRVEKRIPHEAFINSIFANDIALLRVDRDIVFDDKVQPVTLPDGSTIMSNNENVLFTGFGRTQNLEQPRNLQFIYLKMFDYQTCKHYEPRIIETQICTLPIHGEGPCMGDSGGPLVNEYGVQVGIDSGSYGLTYSCGVIPEIYTRISSYLDWIHQKISEN